MRTPTGERWRSLSSYLDRAFDMAPAERKSWLEALEREDETLASDLRELLALDTALDEERFLDCGTPAAALRAALPSLQDGRTLGAYTLETPLGEGGMGTVWLAHRSDGSYEGKAAVKVVRAGLDSKSVLSRFESERHALALMDHPNVARVFDAGTAPDGRPFFVMEYVAGRPLTVYCDERGSSVRDRLELFLGVCAGAQHAHRNGIIHRDLKPSNILVSERDGHPVPKLIDFGIAKATGTERAEATHLTLEGERVGTPAYMSPEQWVSPASGVDTRSDIYALGVVLYELLVGALPQDASSPADRGAPGAGLLGDDTPHPAARFASLGKARERIAANRGTDASGLARTLAGDLSWIMMKAIEREPDHRYQTVIALAADVSAHLGNEPVQAGPPSRLYRARKFIRRHRLIVSAATAVTAALLAGLVIAGVGYSRARRAERVASAERDKAAAINAFLLETFSSADPFEGTGRETTIVQALAGATKRLDTAFANQPETRAAVLATVGQTYVQLGRLPEAISLLEKAVAIRRALRPGAEGELAETLTRLGVAKTGASRTEEGRALLSEALAVQRRLFPEGSVETALTLSGLAEAATRAGDRAAATQFFEEAIDMRGRLLGPEEDRTLEARANFADMLRANGELERAAAILRQVVDVERRRLPQDDPHRAAGLDRLGAVLDEMSKLEEAETVTREALAIRTKALGPIHPSTCDNLVTLGWIAFRRGRLDEAERLYRQAIAGNREAGGPAFSMATYLVELAGLLKEKNDRAGALRAFEEALAIYRREGGADHPYVATTLTNLALLKSQMNDPRGAEALQLEALRIRVRTFGEESIDVASLRESLAVTLGHMKRWDDALAQATLALSCFTRKLGAENETTLRCRANRAMCLWKAGRVADSEHELRAVYAIARERHGPKNEATQMAASYLASLFKSTHRPAEAAKYSELSSGR